VVPQDEQTGGFLTGGGLKFLTKEEEEELQNPPPLLHAQPSSLPQHTEFGDLVVEAAPWQEVSVGWPLPAGGEEAEAVGALLELPKPSLGEPPVMPPSIKLENDSADDGSYKTSGDDVVEINDSDLSHLIIVAQSPAKRSHQLSPRAMSSAESGVRGLDLPDHITKEINQHLYLYERQLRTGDQAEHIQGETGNNQELPLRLYPAKAKRKERRRRRRSALQRHPSISNGTGASPLAFPLPFPSLLRSLPPVSRLASSFLPLHRFYGARLMG